MATKNTTFTLNQNQLSTEVTSQATVTGRTVYGNIVSATETITQRAKINAVLTIENKSICRKFWESDPVYSEDISIQHSGIVVSTIGYVITTQGNFHDLVLSVDDTEDDQYIEINLYENTTYETVISELKITGMTSDGDTLEATLRIEQYAPTLMGTFYLDLSRLYTWSGEVTTVVDHEDVYIGDVSHSVTFDYTNPNQSMECYVEGEFLDYYDRYGLKIVKGSTTLGDVESDQKITITAEQLNGSTWYLYDYGGVIIWTDDYHVNHTAGGGETRANVTCFWANLVSENSKTITFSTPTPGCTVSPASKNTETGTSDVVITFGTNETGGEREIILRATGKGPDGITRTVDYLITQSVGTSTLNWDPDYVIGFENSLNCGITINEMEITFKVNSNNTEYKFKWVFNNPAVGVNPHADKQVNGGDYITNWPGTSARIQRNTTIKTSITAFTMKVSGVQGASDIRAEIFPPIYQGSSWVTVPLVNVGGDDFAYTGSELPLGNVLPDETGYLLSSSFQVIFS